MIDICTFINKLDVLKKYMDRYISNFEEVEVYGNSTNAVIAKLIYSHSPITFEEYYQQKIKQTINTL